MIYQTPSDSPPNQYSSNIIFFTNVEKVKALECFNFLNISEAGLKQEIARAKG